MVNNEQINQELIDWYNLNNKPNRSTLRNTEYSSLPNGYSKHKIDRLLPKLRKLKLPIDRTTRRIVIASDFHIPFCDWEVFNVWCKFLEDYSPDEVILNGNINDCSMFSNFNITREVYKATKSSEDNKYSFFYFALRLREALQDKSKIIYIGSQCHEGRIEKWATSLSPILAEDDNFTIKKYFKLDEFEIDFIPEVYYPIKSYLSDLGKTNLAESLGTSLLVTHGTICRTNAGATAIQELLYNGTSTITAHTHRLAQVFRTNGVGTIQGVECGCMCRRTPWYNLKGKRIKLQDWQQGFVLLDINENGNFTTRLMTIQRDNNDKPFIMIGNKIWK